jgi:excinuclease ABC subunit A
MRADRRITLRGVEVHNLKGIDLDLPHEQLIVICGLSGSGKSSLAFDTLYAEGQRRYIETFSAYTRQFLEQLEKPAADRIEGIPSAIAVAATSPSRSSRSTIGTATEINDYLRLLFAKIGRVVCSGCGHEVRKDSPQRVATALAELPLGCRFLVTFPVIQFEGDDEDTSPSLAQTLAALREDGFVRVQCGEQIVRLDDEGLEAAAANGPCHVVVDRLTAGGTNDQRMRDSLETAFERGAGRASIWVESDRSDSQSSVSVPTDIEPSDADPSDAELPAALGPAVIATIAGDAYQRYSFSAHLRCEACDLDYATPEPRLYSFNSPLGACPECEGFGSVIGVDMDLVVPDKNKSLRDKAIAPWATPAYEHELDELLALADDYDLPVDVPYSELSEAHLRLIDEGVPERDFGGLQGFFAWLQRRKYKMHIRVFLSRWRSYSRCPLCDGLRLRHESLNTLVGGHNIAHISRMKVRDAATLFREMELSDWDRSVGRTMLQQIGARLGFLEQVGLGYLSLERTLRTLSGGESRRVALTSTLGSSLVNMLYVLDEPSIGLHPQDTDRLLEAIAGLRDRGNTVVVVDHEEAILRAADHLVEIGPGAGERGGTVVFEGSPAEITDCTQSVTGDFLSGRRLVPIPQKRRTPDRGWIRLSGARGNNLRDLTVEFPLGLLCVVTGVSGSGKSSLVQDTLYPAICRRLRKDVDKPADFDDVLGTGQIDEVCLVDQSPIGRSPRSNPVTYVKAFDEIRAVFASTMAARTRNYTPSFFSFNAKQGRCNVCEGDGHIEIDMQFMADVYMKCPECHGRRYRSEILDVTYRGRDISDVLNMTVREAFTFFRGHTKVQARLKRLLDVGLDYLRLGQPANTLSGGEAQRLKLAAYMSSSRRGRCLFVLDEPTTGLHFSDIVQLLDCFDSLLSVGHSLVVVEHNLNVIAAADYLIDLGPGAADEGGQIVAVGKPEELARVPESVTGRFLRPLLAAARQRSA